MACNKCRENYKRKLALNSIKYDVLIDGVPYGNGYSFLGAESVYKRLIRRYTIKLSKGLIDEMPAVVIVERTPENGDSGQDSISD